MKMNERDLKLILSLEARDINDSEFLEAFSIDLTKADNLVRFFESIYESKDAGALITSFSLHRFLNEKDFADLLDVYVKFAYADWHQWHEWILNYLKIIGGDKAIDAIFHIAVTDHSLIDDDDIENLAVQCTYALSNIETSRAIEKLQALAESTNERIKSEALQRLEEISESQ